ncbi:hypothetical protein NMY22_g2275 [Coprinellus aureogranulatus]|nr:hypothetical protein NMY22_g2275 [Coprinellus aureogranulatus]
MLSTISRKRIDKKHSGGTCTDLEAQARDSEQQRVAEKEPTAAETALSETHNLPKGAETKASSSMLQFRDNAKIWQLYLQEAEEKADDNAKLWDTGLDSLLIFAGLFAGVVSSFVLDARSGLQPDDQPRLLSDILDVLRNPNSPNSQTAAISSSVYWVNGLWIMSLFTTLFSAIMGVLAKAWVAKYTPKKNRGHAFDAYRRYKLDKQSKRWLFRETLILIPLLVQLATFLFLAGLIVQALGDNATTGRTLLGFCAAGSLLYFWMTIFPYFSPSSPFNTTLSQLIHALYIWKTTKVDKSLFKNNINEGLGEILYEKLILSRKSHLIDAAVTEVAHPAFDPHWIEHLCRNETPTILLSRFKECTTSRTTAESEKIEDLGYHLLAFLAFVDIHDREPGSGAPRSELNHSDGYKTLHKALHQALEFPLHRWDKLPDVLRPLAFALRTNILSLSSSCPPDESEAEEIELDFKPYELLDRPWEMALHDVPPAHRPHFMLAACRGLVQGGAGMPIARTVSAFILCTCIAQAALTISDTERIRWGLLTQRQLTYELSAKYIKKLSEVTVETWEAMVVDAMRQLLPVETSMEVAEDGHLSSTVLVSLVDSLKQPNYRLRTHAIRMLKQALCIQAGAGDELLPFLQGGIATESVKTISRMVVYGEDEDVRGDGMDLLTALLKSHGQEKVLAPMRELHNHIREALSKAIQSGLVEYEDRLLVSTIQFIDKLSDSAPEGSALASVVNRVVSTLAQVALGEGSSQRASRSAVSLLRKLSENDSFTNTVRRGVLDYWAELVSSAKAKPRSGFLEALLELFDAQESPQWGEHLPLASLWATPSAFINAFINATSEELVKVATSEELVLVRDAGQRVMALVARGDRFNSLKPNMLSQLEKCATGEDVWWIRLSAVVVMEAIAQQAPLDLMKDLLRTLLALALRDRDEQVRERALASLRNLLEGGNVNEDLARTVRDVVVSDAQDTIIAFETLNRIRECWIPFLAFVGKHETAVSAHIGGVINPSIMDFLKSDLFSKGAPAASVSSFNGQAHTGYLDQDYAEAFKKVVPQALRATLPTGEIELHRRNWIKILLDLLPTGEYQSSSLIAPSLAITEQLYSPDSAKPTLIQEIAIQALAQVKQDVRDCIDKGVTGKSNRVANDALAGSPTFLSQSSIAPALQRLLERTSPQARLHWAETLGVLAQGYYSSDAGSIILQMAVHDLDRDVRAISIECLIRLAGQGSNPQQSTLLADVAHHVGTMARDKWWRAQLAAFQLHATLPQVQDAGFPYVRDIVDFAVKGDTELVREKATQVLILLLGNGQGTTAVDTGKCLASSFVSMEDWKSAELLLRRLTTPVTYNSGQSEADGFALRHEVWIQVAMLLGKNQFPQIAELIQTAIQGAIHGESADSGLQLEKVPKTVDTALPQCILFGLQSDKPEARLDAISLSAHLLSPGSVRNKRASASYGSLLRPSYDEQLVPRWSEIAIRDDDARLRKAALNLLKDLYHESRFHNAIKSSLRKTVKACFEIQESMKVVKHAIQALHRLMKSNSYEDCERFKDIVSPSIPHLMSITMGARWGHEELREEAKVILLEDLTRFAKQLQVTTEVLDGLPAMIPNLTANGRIVALQFVESLQFTDDTATSFAQGLTPLLSATYSSFSRGVALELLSALYSKHMSSKPQLVECLTSAIQEITALALDEKDEVSGIRTTAIQLLVALCKARKPEGTGTGDRRSSSSTESPVKKLSHLLDEFMELLQNEYLRPSVVELLSMMAAVSEVRRRISLTIITSALGKDKAVLQGNTALLARLISDGRFEDEATDNAVLFLGAVMLRKPELAPYRFEVSTALWCRYRGQEFVRSEKDGGKASDFTRLFILAMFGPYVRAEEASVFLRRARGWISDVEEATEAAALPIPS